MKCQIEPQRLQQLLDMMTLKGRFDTITAEFKKDNVTLYNGKSEVTRTAARLNTVGHPGDRFFLEYEVKTDETVILTSSLLNALKQCFEEDKKGGITYIEGKKFREPKITFSTDDNKLSLLGISETYTEEQQEVRELQKLDKLFENKTDAGSLPLKFIPKTQILLKIQDLSIPPAKSYELSYDGKQLRVTATTLGTYTKTIPICRAFKTEPCKVIVDADSLRPIIETVPNEMWLSMSDGHVIVNLVRKDHEVIFSVETLTEQV